MVVPRCAGVLRIKRWWTFFSITIIKINYVLILRSQGPTPALYWKFCYSIITSLLLTSIYSCRRDVVVLETARIEDGSLITMILSNLRQKYISEIIISGAPHVGRNPPQLPRRWSVIKITSPDGYSPTNCINQTSSYNTSTYVHRVLPT